MTNTRVSAIKRSQKESLLLKEISSLFVTITVDDTRLQELFITRIALSPDKSVVSVFFYTPHGEKVYKQQLEILKLYKPSLRAALAKKISSRYTPDLTFKYDYQYEKERQMNELIEKLKKEGQIE